MEEAEYEIIVEICKNICKNEYLLPDLIQEISIVFLELPEDKKESVRGYFRFWVARVVVNNWRSSSSVFWNKYRKENAIDIQEIGDWKMTDYNLTEDQPEIYDPSEKHKFFYIKKLINELYISDYNVFTDYYYKGLTIMQITDKYKTERSYTWGVLNRIRISIRRRMEWRTQKDLDFRSMLTPLIKKLRLNVGERQLILDIHNHLHLNKVNETHDETKVRKVLNNLILEIY